MCLLHPFIGNERRILTKQQPLLSNGSANKHVSSTTVILQQRTVPTTGSVTRCYWQEKLVCVSDTENTATAIAWEYRGREHPQLGAATR
jgi:hypothetical protein